MGLWETLEWDMERQRVAALVGGGGKTTSLYALAREARDRGRTVVVTTTTRMLPHPGLFLTDDADPERLRELLRRYGAVTVGRLNAEEKLTGVGGLAGCDAAADVVLVEADGARLKPLKAPGEHEPVIPPEADAVAVVCGLDCLEGKIRDVCHRPELVCAIVDKPMDAALSERDVAELLLSPRGGRKNVGSRPFACIFNKADTEERLARGARLRALVERRGVPAAVTCYAGADQGGPGWL